MRFTFIDILKAVAAQFIVLHHLSAYGPIADAIQSALPAVVSWLYNDARMAVQVFLVAGGYLAARTLTLSVMAQPGKAWDAVVSRYFRLAVPFVAALVIAITCASLVRPWFADESVPLAPTFKQLFAHATLLHGVLGVESLSAGAWYVAIDFQLFALLALILCLSSKSTAQHRFAGKLAKGTVLVMAAASLFMFNRDATFDNYAFYFFGAYGLGALAYWTSQWQRPLLGALLIAALGVIALIIEFRTRIAIATTAAVLLVALRNVRVSSELVSTKIAVYFSKTSYALFLIHFPMCLMANALYDNSEFDSAYAATVIAIMAWLASNLLADYFYRHVELRALKAERPVATVKNWFIFWLSRLILGITPAKRGG